MAKPVAPAPVAPKPAPPAPAAPIQPAAVTQDAARMTAAVSRVFDIEDDIPLPVKRIGVKGESIYPFATIGINQSFFVGATGTNKEPWKTLTSMASRMSRDLHPKKFITARMTDKDGVEGVRIWRAADETKPLAPLRARGSKADKADKADKAAVNEPAGDE